MSRSKGVRAGDATYTRSSPPSPKESAETQKEIADCCPPSLDLAPPYLRDLVDLLGSSITAFRHRKREAFEDGRYTLRTLLAVFTPRYIYRNMSLYARAGRFDLLKDRILREWKDSPARPRGDDPNPPPPVTSRSIRGDRLLVEPIGTNRPPRPSAEEASPLRSRTATSPSPRRVASSRRPGGEVAAYKGPPIPAGHRYRRPHRRGERCASGSEGSTLWISTTSGSGSRFKKGERKLPGLQKIERVSNTFRRRVQPPAFGRRPLCSECSHEATLSRTH